MKKLLLAALLTILSLPALLAGTVDPSLIPGTWLAEKYVIFYPDGRLALQKNEGAPLDGEGRGWSLKDDQLTWITPDGSFTETILKLDDKVMMTKDQNGNRATYERVK